MDVKIVGFAVMFVILLIAALAGFYEYSTISSKYTSLQSSYSSATSQISSLNASLMYAKNNESYYMKLAENNYTAYTKLEAMYSALEHNYSMLMQMYKELEANYSQAISHVGAQYLEGASLDTVYLVWDGIAIENPNDVTPYLAPNFTAKITGVPFPGTYNLQTFNATWLANFFSTYETVYFYTTALPTVTQENNNTFVVSAILQYFVAPTQDPVYLQVFNASFTATVQIINGKPLITSITWNGNEVPPSAVIAGYPSQHQLEGNVVLSEVLSEINALGGEFAPNVIAQNFAPNAILNITGPLPPGLKNGTYMGLNNIEMFFSQWDNYFIFVAEYSQNLLPNGTAVPPSVSVTLMPNMTMAVVKANVTPFIAFVNQGQPGFPGIYDIHVDLTAYLVYNSTTATWQIVKEDWVTSLIPIQQDTMFYNFNTPTFNVVAESTVTVNASKGAVVQAGNIVTIVQPGTYAELPNGSLLSIYNFSLVIMSVQAVYSPPGYGNLTPTYAFAFAINGHISPLYSLVTENKTARPAITIVYAPDTWTSWTWFGGTFNGTTYIGGSYKFADHWIYGNGVMVNVQFFKPVIWIFEASQAPVATPPTPATVSVGEAYGLTPVNAYTYTVNGKEGGVIVAGNIIVVIKPGTYVETPQQQNLTTYNFSVVFYATSGLPNAPTGQTPFLAFAYAFNGNVNFSYYATQSFITIITAPSQEAEMWTWGAKGYMFEDPRDSDHLVRSFLFPLRTRYLIYAIATLVLNSSR
ncbi:MAG: hypothetical protein TQ35_0003020 [Candidatus Aramenus sulfurataquae]|jgi:hypothetical protein|uniref:Uncharacterized protein n=2 Tax=Candidatus Aramenus sulfurataquae TaxID=1326980 RepID=A0AAE3K178_9CREN|nr:hypothetical protein [Candidatus Aramenus sulfurataquae]